MQEVDASHTVVEAMQEVDDAMEMATLVDFFKVEVCSPITTPTIEVTSPMSNLSPTVEEGDV